MQTTTLERASWRVRLKRDVSWLMVLKIGALTALWGAFFSASHRCRVDAVATANRMGLTGLGSSQELAKPVTGGDRCD
jgi:hypothetical protein